jgi:hypothetical protein
MQAHCVCEEAEEAAPPTRRSAPAACECDTGASPQLGPAAYALALQRTLGNRAAGAVLTHRALRQATDPSGGRTPASGGSPHVVVHCDEMRISFSTPIGEESYPLTLCDMPSGDYTAAANVTGSNLTLDFGTSAPEGVRFEFSYAVAPGQRDPTQLFTVNGERVSVEVVGGAGEAAEELVSRVDTELARELARIDATRPGSVVEVPANARPLESVMRSDATYGLAVTAGFVSTTGYTVPPAVAAEGAAAAEGLLAARGLAAAGSTVAEGATVARSLIAGGQAILAIEAAGAGEAELAAGPPGWVVGAVVLLAAGAAIGIGYLLLRPEATAGPRPATTAAPTTATATRRHPNQTCENDVLDRLQAEMHRICDAIPGESCSPSKVSPKRLARRPCSQIRLRIAALRACMAARQRIQDECFGGIPDQTHIDAMNMIQNALTACLALEAVNCAPGHPMAGL